MTRRPGLRPVAVAAALAAAAALGSTLHSQPRLPQDRGAAGTYHTLLKLTTTASALHTTAHPDDEHGGVITRISRKEGARLALMTLNRGESGDNAIGSQLFDGLGLIRTEELLVSNAWYGVDRQYFTTVIDYGFSKRIDEALEKWGRENVLRDVVRVIRTERPFVLVSRFQGNQRDGHGNHQTAGLLTTEAFKAAGDPDMFPEQIKEGLRPWQPFKVYVGGTREDENWTVRVDSGEFSPWLGDSYNNFAREGLSYQRSQTSGRRAQSAGPAYGYYTRVGSRIETAGKESSFFDGLDTTIPGIFTLIDKPAPAGVDQLLSGIDAAVKTAMTTFKGSDPAAIVPSLTQGLKLTREAISRSAEAPEAVFLLEVKERQFVDAINTALGLELEAVAQPAGLTPPTGPMAAFAPPPTLDAVVPGQSFEIRATLANRGGATITLQDVTLDAERGWQVKPVVGQGGSVGANGVSQHRFEVQLADDVRLSSKPYFSRTGLQESRYTLADPAQFGYPRSQAPAAVVARYTVNGVPVTLRETVRRREARLPYGFETRELRVVPAVAVRVSPGTAIIPTSAPKKTVTLSVDVLNNAPAGSEGAVTLRLPQGWTSSPARHPFRFERSGERAAFEFTVTAPSIENKPYPVTIVAAAGGREYTEGYDIIEHRDLETAYLYRPSVTTVRGVDVAVATGPEGRLRDGRRGPGAGRDRAARLRGHAARRAGAGQRGPLEVRRDHDRHARLRRPRGPQDLQPAAPRVRREGRQPRRALQHAGDGAEPLRAVPGHADGPRRGGVGGGFAGRDPRARAPGVHLAQQDHPGGFRELGGAARLEVLERVGPEVHRHALDA